MGDASGESVHLVIVGGGTAGWLAAHLLQAEATRIGKPVSITLVESSRIPTIGVGEGTTSIFGGVLQALGFDEAEFLANTDATIKYGIRHRDWRKKGHYYDGPIDDVYSLADSVPGAGAWIDTFCVATGRSVAEPHLFAALMRAGKAPVVMKNGRQVAVSRYHHAYHFDQAKVGHWLRAKAQGINTLDAVVEGAERDTHTGDITSLILDNGQVLAGDFYIDCSGFQRVLAGGVMGVEWLSYADVLPVNRAMPFWLALQPDEEIPTFTHAFAQSAGWMWQIPTQERLGCGYVYSDQHISAEQAQAEVEQVLGHPIEPRADIPIHAGRLAQVWSGNVLALGLSASFLEPLEATSIHGTVVSLLLFAQRHLQNLGQPDPGQARFNKAIADQVDDFRDFINLHYVSERDDSSFWQDVAQRHIKDKTHDKLRQWQAKMPGTEDFVNDLDGLPHVEQLLHYPVLDGLGLLNRETARKALAHDPRLRRFARQTVDHLTRQSRVLAGQAISHRRWLQALRQAVGQ